MFAIRKLVAPALVSLLSGTALLAAVVSGQTTTVGADDTRWRAAEADCPADTHWSVDLNACVPNDQV